MGIVTAYLASAVICFAGECHPMLTGISTPTGTFPLVQARIDAPGYGGDVLLFAKKNNADDVYLAIHRVWNEIPEQKRYQKLGGTDPSNRRTVSAGCINVHPTVYKMIVDCCSGGQLIIK